MAVVSEQEGRPAGKAQLLARMAASWDELERVVATASAGRLVSAGPDGGWSAKEHLAHLSIWEGRLLAFLQGQTLATYGQTLSAALGMDPTALEGLQIDALNARFAEQSRKRPLDDVLATWRSAHREVLAALAGLSDADLKAPFPDPDDPSDRQPLLGSGVLDGNTYAHYEEHAASIRALLTCRPPG